MSETRDATRRRGTAVPTATMLRAAMVATRRYSILAPGATTIALHGAALLLAGETAFFRGARRRDCAPDRESAVPGSPSCLHRSADDRGATACAHAPVPAATGSARHRSAVPPRFRCG